jgi:spermidine/putrescine transport system ATP-binding protein
MSSEGGPLAGGEVQIVGLCKRFGDVEAVAGIDLDVPSGEFFSILGPSGCGKTTTLRLVAGFEQPTSGSIYLDGVDVADKPPHKRNVNTVFQSYALFPFLSVADNVAFGLRYQRLTKAESTRRTGAALELVQLLGYEKRRPGQLSGGQQQRVALARALVLNPAVLLLDEPLGALDAKLRRTLQIELKALQETVGITFLYVTHDQEEALTMSDRLAVMESGKVAQVGTPVEVYEQPVDAYVADFLGVSNLMDANAGGPGPGDGCRITLGTFHLMAEQGSTDCVGPVKVAVRPERIGIEPYDASGPNRVPGMVERLVFLGSSTQVIIRLAHGQTVQVLLQNRGGPPPYEQGTAVQVHLPPDGLRVLRSSVLAPVEDPPLNEAETPSVQPVGLSVHHSD